MPALGNHLDFAKYEARNVVIQNGNPNPAAGQVKGQLFFNNVDNTLWFWDGTAWIAAKSGAPSGNAGGDLIGTYPNPTIGLAKIDDTHVKAANKDGVAGTASMRTLGSGATQAAAGNDARLSDARAPTAHKTNHEPGGSDPMTVNAAVGVGSLRTLALTSLAAMPGDTPLNSIANPTAARAMNSQKITGLADGTAATDAVTKQQLDAIVSGLDVKASCRVAPNAVVTIASPGASLDGITMAAGERVLLMWQGGATTTPHATNGVYVWNGAAVPMTRAPDADTSAEVTAGLFTFVSEGTNADSGWYLKTNNPITLGTTALEFTQFSGAGQITAGAGLTKTGNQIDAAGTANRITVAADSIDISTAYVGQATITTLGTITTGVWTGTDVAVADGGTGASAAPAARTNLGAAGYYSSATHGAGATITITAATHGCRASRGLIVQVQEEATGLVVLTDTTVAANGDVTVTFGASVAANAYRVTVIG